MKAITGNTYEIKEILKGWGFSWNVDSKVWVGDDAAMATFEKYIAKKCLAGGLLRRGEISISDFVPAAKKFDAIPEGFVRASCGHLVRSNLIMNANFGTSCPDCYDRMSN